MKTVSHKIEWRRTAMIGKLTALMLLCLAGGNAIATNSVSNATDTTAATTIKSGKAADYGENLRDPFWPIGYVSTRSGLPRPTSTGGGTPDAAPAPTVELKTRAAGLFKIGGVVQRGGRYFATVNGQTVVEGDIIPVVIDGQVIPFVVRHIGMGGVRIEPLKK